MEKTPELNKQEINRMDIKEFRELGFLQELNRRFLHPLGLAMEIVLEEDGSERLGGIWDYREDEEGIYYDIANSDDDRKERFRKNKKFIDELLDSKMKSREEKLGFGIEKVD